MDATNNRFYREKPEIEPESWYEVEYSRAGQDDWFRMQATWDTPEAAFKEIVVWNTADFNARVVRVTQQREVISQALTETP